jgi:hypothetical protein
MLLMASSQGKGGKRLEIAKKAFPKYQSYFSFLVLMTLT